VRSSTLNNHGARRPGNVSRPSTQLLVGAFVDPEQPWRKTTKQRNRSEHPAVLGAFLDPEQPRRTTTKQRNRSEHAAVPGALVDARQPKRGGDRAAQPDRAPSSPSEYLSASATAPRRRTALKPTQPAIPAAESVAASAEPAHLSRRGMPARGLGCPGPGPFDHLDMWIAVIAQPRREPSAESELPIHLSP